MSTGDTLSMRKLSSVKDIENHTPVSVIEQAAAFCPQGGLLQGSDCDFGEEIRCLLGRRLRAAALILFAGFAAFLVRNLFHESTRELGGTLTLTLEVCKP
jgi:hypothetical protein